MICESDESREGPVLLIQMPKGKRFNGKWIKPILSALNRFVGAEVLVNGFP